MGGVILYLLVVGSISHVQFGLFQVSSLDNIFLYNFIPVNVRAEWGRCAVFFWFCLQKGFPSSQQELLWVSDLELQVNGSSLQGGISLRKAQPAADSGITAGETLIGCRREEGKKALDRLKFFSVVAAF